MTLEDAGELAAITRLCRGLRPRADIVVGPGDDCAVVRLEENAASDLLLTSDPVIEGTHFLPTDDPGSIGHKAIGRALSDIAAMGGEPEWAVVNIAAPSATPLPRIDAIYAGALSIADRYGLAIVGGDVCRSDLLALHVFAVGRVPRAASLLRSGASSGDLILVSGTLGGSPAGRHLTFTPRLTEGMWLRESTWATSAIDLSDGLARDAAHLASASNVRVIIDLASLPLSPDASTDSSRSEVEHALFDGEDFELLFTTRPEHGAELAAMWNDTFDVPCTVVGRVAEGPPGVTYLDPQGAPCTVNDVEFKHFQ